MVERTQRLGVTVEAADAGARADVVLGRHVQGVSRRVARSMGLQGRLRINDRPMPPSTRVRAGDRIELRFDVPAARDLPPPRILAVTNDIVYVDKPSGLHTHRLRPDDPPALGDAVAVVHPECASASEDPREGGAVHRLDFETSGVVAFARSRHAWKLVHEAIRSEAVCKLYVALCEGDPSVLEALATAPQPSPVLPEPLRVAPSSGTFCISAPIGRGADRGLCRVRPDGLPAQTLVWVLDPAPAPHDPPRRLYSLRLLTGRRHQARVHLAHVGLPIVGDTRYGGAPGPRLALHALRLDLSSVVPGQSPVDAPLPTVLSCPGGGGFASP